MYGLPASFDASVFIGRKLELICYSSNSISLSFEEDVSITIIGSFTHQRSSTTEITKHKVPVFTSDLMCLIGNEVCVAEGQKNGNLILQFSNDHILTLLDDSKDYEAYSIRIGNQEIVV